MTARSSLADPARLLAAWEAGAGAPELARGCAVLGAAGLADPASLLDVPVGLVGTLGIRCFLTSFGSQVDALTACQACGATLDVALSLTELLPGQADVPAGATVRLVMSFDQPGALEFACHVPGHYPAGMRGTITVTPS